MSDVNMFAEDARERLERYRGEVRDLSARARQIERDTDNRGRVRNAARSAAVKADDIAAEMTRMVSTVNELAREA